VSRTLTDFQIAEIALNAGFPYPSGVVTAVAVALAESGGRPDATNEAGNHPPSTDRGLWQINSYWHPEVSDGEAFDPIQAAKETLRISNGGKDWHPWATYNSGSYLTYLHRAELAARAVVPGAFVLHRYLRLAHPNLYGVDVAALQHALHITSDGVFGPLTAAAVHEFQTANHLESDGIVGPKTCRPLGWSWVGPKSGG
jgi:peptidoglycan hydrolase-like protein with peptidoglycan-binding domain